MKRAARWVGAAIALAAGVGQAQTPPPATPDVPGGDGTIRGRIVHATRPAAAADLPVLLYALPESAPPGVREGVADAEGRFVFSNVSSDPHTVYLIGVRVGEVPFGVRIRFAGGEREHAAVVSISDPTPDAAGVGVEEARWQLESGCDSLLVNEAHTLRNPTSRVIFVPESERKGREPLFRTTLPEDATGFEGHAGMFAGGVVLDGQRVAFWGPLYPGEQRLEFAWALPVKSAEARLARVLDSGAQRLRVRTPAESPAPTAKKLGAGRVVHEDGRAWREQEAGRVAPGERVEIAAGLPPPVQSDALSLSEAQLWLELDDAALEVDTQLKLVVSGVTPLVSASGAPLLCLPLPPGAEGLRFASQALELGLSPDAADRLALRGPLPPGESILALRYHLPARDGALALALRFPLSLPLLSVFATDTGVSVDAERMHRRRSFRNEDRGFLHWEAFEVAAGETVDLSLARLAPRRPLPTFARAGFAVLLAGCAMAFLIAPLRSPEAEPALVSPRALHAAAERESVLAALRDLEEDFATGKLDVADHAQMRSELRARAVWLLAAERDARDAPAPAAPVAPSAVASCPSCSAAAAPGARFCSSCGVRLGTPPRGAGDGSR
ncbi:MAG TPA: zinc ribbon domain-containing protein [Myxococcota bacterium]|jgi:hypothetical protein